MTNWPNGSSPHPWGIRQRTLAERNRLRFIPTSVGNTHYRRYTQRPHAVHPHIRGEYVIGLVSLF